MCSLNWGKSRMLNAPLSDQAATPCFDHSHFSLLDLSFIQLTVLVICAVSVTPWLKLALPAKWKTSTSARKTEKATGVSLSTYPFFGSFTFIYLTIKACDTFLWVFDTQIPWNRSTSQCVYAFIYLFIYLLGSCCDSQAVLDYFPRGCNLFIQTLKQASRTPTSPPQLQICVTMPTNSRTTAWSNLLIAPVTVSPSSQLTRVDEVDGWDCLSTVCSYTLWSRTRPQAPPPRRQRRRSLVYLWVLTDQRRAAVTLLKSLFLR